MTLAPRHPVTFDAGTRRLTVGSRSTIVPDVADRNEAMLRGFLALVAEARRTAVASATQLRQDDIAVLAEVLDLDDTELEARFVRLLGMSVAVAADTRRRIARHRALLAAAGMTVGLFAAGTAAAAAPAADSTVVVSAAVSAASVAPALTATATPPAPQPYVAPRIESTQPAPAPSSDTATTPQSSNDVEIGDALVIERGTPPDDPNTQIGDAVTYER